MGPKSRARPRGSLLVKDLLKVKKSILVQGYFWEGSLARVNSIPPGHHGPGLGPELEGNTTRCTDGHSREATV
jgi:hypothetical protein